MNHSSLSRANRRLLALLTMFLSFFVPRAPARGDAAREGRPPNIIYFLADDLGYAELGCYGQRWIKTPNIDRLAAEGMRFTQHYSGNAVCAPSRCSLMTGKHPGHAYIRSNGNPPERRGKGTAAEGYFPGQYPIPDAEVTIAEMLKEKGYATAAIGKWGLGYEGSSGDPNRQGFDLFYGFLCQVHAHNHYPRFLWRNGKKELLPGNDRTLYGKTYSQDRFTEVALEFLRENRDRPFFLYMPFAIPHLSIQVPETSLAEYKGKIPEEDYEHRGYLKHPFPRAGYAAMISHLDRDIGRIMALVKELGLDRNTLTVFSSDNGPTFDRLGGSDSEFFESAGPFRGLKGSLYEGGIRVPMIARWPGRIRPRSVTDHISAFWDVLPTVAEITGTTAPQGVDGISFAATLFDEPEKQKQHEFLYWEFPGYGGQQVVRQGDWKAVRQGMLRRNNRTPLKIELYNLDRDIGERKDVAGEHPDIVRKMREIMNEEHTPSALFPMAPIDAAARTERDDRERENADQEEADQGDASAARKRSPSDPSDGLEIVRRWTFDSNEDARGWEAGEGIADLRVENGRLVGRIQRSDAYVFAPAVRAPLDGLVVKVRWSSSRAGTGQCYYTTNLSPEMGEDKVISKPVRGGTMVETTFPIPTGDHDAPAVLTRFRLDPFNGVEGVLFEIDEVALVRLPSRVEIGFGPVKSVVDVGEEVAFRIWLRHRGGRRPEGTLDARVERAGAPDVKLLVNAEDKDPEGTCTLTFRTPGAHVVRARVRQQGRLTHDLEASILVGRPARPSGPLIQSRGVGIELVPSALARDATGAGRLWVRRGGDWHDAGLLLPLVEIIVDDAGTTRRMQPALRLLGRSDRQLRLGLAPQADGPAWRPELTLGFEELHGATDGGRGENGSTAREIVRAQSTLRGPRGGRLRKFSGIRVRRLARTGDPLDRYGLFGGVEFLEPGERSSSASVVGPKFADRWTPHPFKICLPVMAIEQDSVTTAVLWDPLQEWTPGHAMPAATFASPDVLTRRREHRLEVFAPSVGDFVDENGTLATHPFVISDDEPVRIATALHIGWREPVIRTARRWYETFGVPAAPPAPHDMKATYDLIARCYGETVYWPAEKGWRHHWFLDTTSRYRPDMAAELVLHAKETGERRWVEATGLDRSASVIETAGTLWNQALGGARGAESAIRRMREDGTYAYHDSPSAKAATRRHTGGRFDTLGEEGSTSLGTCVQGLEPLLRHVRLTGYPGHVRSLEKGLRALRRFRVPRGAQVWEVHKDIPDIRAAALAVEAYRIGYLASGDASYLHDAFYWADTGLAFLFTWPTPHNAEPAVVRTSRDREDAAGRKPLPTADLFLEPRRQVNPYGTIPVLGTTFYVISWFGVIVQWCGLEWAWKVLELCDVHDDPILRAAAEGVVRSGLQQTFDRPPWTGLYPDVWNLEGNWAGGALICPHLTVRALRAAGHIPQALRQWTRAVGPGRDARLVNGWGEVVSCEGSREGTTERLSVVLRFLEEEPGELLVARSARPHAVRVAGKPLEERAAGVREGWHYDEERRLLGVRFLVREKETRISIDYR